MTTRLRAPEEHMCVRVCEGQKTVHTGQPFMDTDYGVMAAWPNVRKTKLFGQLRPCDAARSSDLRY